MALATWYRARRRRSQPIGFFQIGGGIAGDFPICVVPMLHQDLRAEATCRCGVLLPDQRLDDELRLVLGRGAQREDHLGQARRGHAAFIIESDATIVRAAHVREDTGLVTAAIASSTSRYVPGPSGPK